MFRFGFTSERQFALGNLRVRVTQCVDDVCKFDHFNVNLCICEPVYDSIQKHLACALLTCECAGSILDWLVQSDFGSVLSCQCTKARATKSH